ncbi:hypothetical protein H257_02813 [Aphanomyces astaci]|uniref:GOLD domain-containing protein n=1 Tax=Aphanomyces astaci TaxID=112090 RepID=W4H005_APHAT|nr:hypothetical protein H257_02813 [Aphanomyces astaci]ETV84911.1 hypothetical protein H257_02813 [Aphanomyces astaci]|eukprot:XP_009824929.1 hypothetical protein H257_02813 [Aphanomyces astaci]
MTRRAKEQRQKRLELKRTVETAEEIERRQKWTLLLKQIDTPARPRTMSAPQMLTWHSSHAVVAAAGKFELPVRVEHAGSELSYTFNTKDMDINFSITFAGTTSEEYMVHPTRCASHESTIRGCHKVPGPGTVVLVWDNEYSWINSKELSYHVGLAQTSSPPTGVSGRSLLEGELRTRQAKHRVLNESYDNLRLQCTKRAAAIDAIERQLEELQQQLQQEADLHAMETTEADRVGREVDVVAAELAALSWRTLSPASLAHILEFCPRDDWKQWSTLNRAWHATLAPLLRAKAT